ncbi:MAG: hypothetical protein IIB38_01755 [Candidatus Hydrogenedentes bacterium]|nr:hypothetical protein [Candidatus Hydrogenedentota bacterium]
MPSKPKPTVQRETELYAPVRDYLTELGYTVRGEVKGCDIAAVRDKELIVVELKRTLSIDLLIQATQRQTAADAVYIAIPRPAKMTRNGRWRGIKRLLRRLELGLIIVTFTSDGAEVRLVEHPVLAAKRRDRKRHRVILRELAGRSGDHNVGGMNRKKVLTAYRESALRIACCLERFGPMSPKDLRALETGTKTQRILHRNVYGWFDRVERGVYEVNASGREALDEYPELVPAIRAKLERTGISRVA